MTEIDFLLWVKGPAFTFAVFVFVAGLLIRLVEVVMLGRKPNLAEARGNASSGGFREIWRRTLPADQATFKRSSFVIVSGYLFHIGLFVVIFFFVPHILLIDSVFGISWPGLPTPIVDAFSVLTMIALIAVLIHRVKDRVRSFLSTPMDYVVWSVTFLPLITGYLSFHHLLLSPNMLLALHILSVEALMVLFPFSKLMHAFSFALSRYYNGSTMGFKGVKS